MNLVRGGKVAAPRLVLIQPYVALDFTETKCGQITVRGLLASDDLTIPVHLDNRQPTGYDLCNSCVEENA